MNNSNKFLSHTFLSCLNQGIKLAKQTNNLYLGKNGVYIVGNLATLVAINSL